jgi:hypothetical protein
MTNGNTNTGNTDRGREPADWIQKHAIQKYILQTRATHNRD